MAQRAESFISDLYHRQFDGMIRYAYYWLENVEMAQDVVHEAFLIAFFKAQEGMSHPNPEGWLMQILRNLIKNKNKKVEHKNPPVELTDQMPAPDRETTIDEVLPAQRITEKDLQILHWRYEQRLTYKEMAQLLEIDESTCRQRCFRLIKKCKSLLDGNLPIL